MSYLPFAALVALLCAGGCLKPNPAYRDGGESPDLRGEPADARPFEDQAPAGEADLRINLPEVLIPGGSFQMGGADAGLSGAESPRHRVDMQPFYLDVFEVTVAAYKRCQAESPDCPQLNNDPKCNTAPMYGTSRDDHPVNCISQVHARRFCRWAGRRLPTESEWEYAARGDRPDDTFPWGSEAPQGRACWDQPQGTTCKVGSYARTLFGRPNAQGLADLAGNLLEMTDSQRGVYPDKAACLDNCVVRGGAYKDDVPEFLRVVRRFAYPPDNSDKAFGFRCARDP